MKRPTDPTEERFLKDVAEHRLIVIKDDGVYRHIRFKQPDSGNMYFDLLTWPGYLCYTGDMGTYVFTRVEDMFEFFRKDQRNNYGIDYRYWAEKCVSRDREGIKEYSPDKFREAVARWLESEEEISASLREEIDERVLSRADDGEYEAMRAVYEFEHEGFRFRDFSEATIDVYTYRFVWCCYALQWGIQEYDAAKAKAA